MNGEGFGRTPEGAEVDALAPAARAAVRVVEECIRARHVCEVDYTDARGVHETLRVRPAFIRTNSAEHVVLWGMPVGVDDWRELRLDRMSAARDTGEPFEPSWT